MKKLCFIIIALFVSICAFGQSEHLKFMGIELNGSINEFQTKLQAKGVKVSSLSSKMPNGVRLFDGIFSGEKAQIAVFYNPRSKDVYRAKAIIERFGKDRIEHISEEMEAKLDLKYGTDSKNSGSQKDDYLQEFKQITYDVGNGTISLYVLSSLYIIQTGFNLHIDYCDAQNYAANMFEEMEDL